MAALSCIMLVIMHMTVYWIVGKVIIIDTVVRVGATKSLIWYTGSKLMKAGYGHP